MNIRRPFLQPALALTLISLASGLGVPCAQAESSVCAARGTRADQEAPSTNNNGRSQGSALVLEQAAKSPTSHGRWSPATSAVSHREQARLISQTLYQRAPTLTQHLVSTPLYLRHCSILR